MSELSSTVSIRIFRQLRAEPHNKRCFDCPCKNPQWCSIPFGIWLCVNCAAVHRRMGTHVSFVRSSILDRWNQDQMMHMMVGGNKKAYAYFKQHGWMEENADKRTAKFTSKAAVQYKAHVQKLRAQQRMALLAQINAKPQVKEIPKLPSGSEGLDALMGEIKDKNAKSAASMYAPRKFQPKPQIPQKTKPLPSSLQAKIKPTAPVRRVIIRKKNTKERKTTSRVIRSKANPRKSKLTTSLSTSSRRGKVTIGSNRGTSVDDDLDAALRSLKVAPPTQVIKPKIEPVVPKVDERKEYEKEQRQRRDEDNRRKDDSRLNKYNNSKSISSDQYFERGDYQATTLQDKMRLEKFSNSGAISSDAFFDRQEGTSESQTANAYDSISTVLGQRGRQFGGMATGFYASAKARYYQSG